MEGEALLKALCELAADAGLEVRMAGAQDADTLLESGVCRVGERIWVVMVAGDPIEHRIEVVAGALREHGAEHVEHRFIPPALRERLER